MRWDKVGLEVSGASVRAKFQRNEVGMRGFLKGVFGRPEDRPARIEDEEGCMAAEKEFTSGAGEENWHNAREFREARIDIQIRKAALGLPLDTPKI